MLLYHVTIQPHVHTIAPPPRTPIPVPALPPYLRTPPVFKPIVSVNTNQSDYFVILSCHISLYILVSLLCKPPLTNSLSLWLPSDSGLRPPPRNYRTYPLMVWVGATHKLKPSPTHYPPPIICWPPPTQLRTSDSDLPPESTPNTLLWIVMLTITEIYIQLDLFMDPLP